VFSEEFFDFLIVDEVLAADEVSLNLLFLDDALHPLLNAKAILFDRHEHTSLEKNKPGLREKKTRFTFAPLVSEAFHFLTAGRTLFSFFIIPRFLWREGTVV
jgi:hypothetical protein